MAELPIQFSGDENHVHPRHTGHRWVDLLLAICAIFISAVSLYVAVEHGRTEQKLVAANSWPFLAVSFSGGPNRVSFDMNNSGVGPAKLERFELFYRGEPVPNLTVLLARCCGYPLDAAEQQARDFPHYTRSSISNTVFRPGAQLEVLSLPLSGSDHGVSSRLQAGFKQISFRGCYCSVFDECWSSDFLDLTPKKVASCRAGPSFND